ncbi:MAG: hypothetical protein AAF655_10025 [Bacteroidota bacterium]
MIRICILLTILWGFASLPLWGQCCSGGVPIASNLGLTAKPGGTLQLQATYDYNNLTDFFTGTEELDDDTRIRITHSWLLEANYDFSSAFAINTLFSYVRQERRIKLQLGGIDETVNTGVGDAIILFKYNVFHKNPQSKTQLTIGVGPKLPLGRIDFLDNNGILLPADLQPGTGAWDALFWTNFNQFDILRPTTLFTAIASFRATSTALRNNEIQDYKFGNEFQIQAGISDRFLLGNKYSIDPSILFRFRTVEKDLIDGVAFESTGGTYFFWVPSISLNFSPTLSVRAFGNIPLYREVGGGQVTTSYKLGFSVYYSLNTRKNTFLNIPN